MSAKPADIYNLLRDNWITDDPSDYVRLTQLWLDAASDYANAAGTQFLDDGDLDGWDDADVMKLAGTSMRFGEFARHAERKAAVMADTTRVVIEARAELAALCREGTAAVAAAADGDALIASYRDQTAAVRAAFDTTMSEPSRARRVPLIMAR